jgi:hypothetical protein
MLSQSEMCGLTFEVRGPQKAQPFVGPLDRRVRALVAEAHRRSTPNGSWPPRGTKRREIEACKAMSAFAVHGSLKARGRGATRRVARSQNPNVLTIQVREAQAIDRLNMEREAPFTE